MAGSKDHETEDDDLIAARWVLAIEEGLAPGQADAFQAWLAARPERAELIARQAALHSLTAQPPSKARPWDRRAVLGGAVAVAGIAAIGSIVVARAPWTAQAQRYETAVGEMRDIELEESSRLWLDTRTCVSARISAARRELSLVEGRLFIEAAQDPERPLVVRCAAFEARALGTSFEVTTFAGRAGVAVLEGVVRLTTRSGAVDVSAGEAAWILESGEAMRAPAPAASIGAWRERRMVLADRRLDEALAELSRYFDRPLLVADAELAARRVSLSFSIADMREADAAALIAEVVDAEVVDHAGDGVLLRPSAH